MGAYTIYEPFFIIHISARLLALFTDSFLLDNWFTLFFFFFILSTKHCIVSLRSLSDVSVDFSKDHNETMQCFVHKMKKKIE